jgi:hypothetical protein
MSGDNTDYTVYEASNDLQENGPPSFQATPIDMRDGVDECGVCPLQSYGDYGVAHTVYDGEAELGRVYMCPTMTPVGQVLSQHFLVQNEATLGMVDYTREIVERLKQEVFGEAMMDTIETGVCWLVHGRRCSCTGDYEATPKGLFYLIDNILFINANTEDAYKSCPDAWLQDVYECIAFALARSNDLGRVPRSTYTTGLFRIGMATGRKLEILRNTISRTRHL